MKKSIRKAIISLALCASATCIVGGVSFMQSEHEVAAAATTTEYKTLDGFTIEDGASIRNTSPNGIRFQTILDNTTKGNIGDLELSGVGYGTIMIPADFLGTQELTHATAKILDVPTTSWQVQGTEWTSVLVGSQGADLSETYYNRPIVARSYITGKDSGGNTIYYYTENTAMRSIGYVAMMETLRPEYAATEGSLIETIVDATNVEIVFNDAGMISVEHSSTEGTALITNALGTTSDKVAKLRIGGMLVSDDATLPANFPTISYTSENTDIISVDGSTLTANAAGKASVTATCTLKGKDYSTTKILSTAEYVGQSDYKILITEKAMAADKILNSDFNNGAVPSTAKYEKAAAEMLQKILLEATGVNLPIVTTDELKGSKYISIGETTQAASTTLSDAVKAKDTASEVFVDDKGNVYIRGSVANESILNGVQQFLGDTVGYDFYMENTYGVDTNVEVIVTAKSYVPDIAYNVIQSDLRTDGVMADYAMQDYTRGIIPLGVNKDNQRSYNHQGTAHNSVLVVQQEAIADGVENGVGNITYVGTTSDNYYYGQAYDSSLTYGNWYATNSDNNYTLIANPYYSNDVDPFAVTTKTTAEDGTVTYTKTASYEYLPAELCYTAHGVGTARTALVNMVADEMLKQLADSDRTRLGFSHMDHRIWCKCTYCTANNANPSDNLLEFLLDVAAAVESGLEAKGDTRKDTFKISSLFYHATNEDPVNTENYETKLTDYGKHIEVWFAETGADYIVPFDDEGSKWNPSVNGNLTGFANIATCGMDILWWSYYGTTVQFFIPYDSTDALRANYGIAKNNGVDIMFNQMMQSKVNFSRLKEYLMSQLQWDADVKDDVWNSWISDYFANAYGAGSSSMTTYYKSWKQWVQDNKSVLMTSTEYSATATSVSGGIGRTDALSETYLSEATLTTWIDTIDQAIAALDPTDPNYDTQYWNIKLEKATPLYLIMYIQGEYSSSTSTTAANFGDESYAKHYGAEFLEIIDHWGITNYGEGDTRTLTDFKTAINDALSDGTSTTVEDRQLVVAGETSFTLTNEAVTTGYYTVKIISDSDVTTISDYINVTTAGSITISAALTPGKTYIVELDNYAQKKVLWSTTYTYQWSVKFTNVLAITGYVNDVSGLQALSGKDGYYMLNNDIDCAGTTLNSIAFTGTLDGDNRTISNFTVGANGIFGANSVTLKNVKFADVTVTGDTATATNVFGSGENTYKNVSVGVDNAADTWPSGVNVNYTKLDKKQYMVSGQKDVTLYSDIFVAGQTYTVTVDGVNSMATVYVNGKLSTTAAAMTVGAQKTIVCHNNATNNAYGFDVIGITKFITNVSELAAIGVGGYVNGERDETLLYDSNVAGNDNAGYYVLANDIDCQGAIIYPGHNYGASNFIGLFDGYGYTISNFTTGDSGIFGGLKNATIKNVNFEKVSITNRGAAIPGWNYGALLAHTATNTTFENISASYVSLNFNVDDVDDSNTTSHSIYYNGLLVGYKTENVHYENVLLDVTNVEKVYAIFGPNVSGLTCNDVTVYMKASLENWMNSQYGGIIYGYTGNKEVENMILVAPEGVSVVYAFSITTPEREIKAGGSLTIETNNDTGKKIEFSIEPAVDGVEINSETGETGELTVKDYVLPNTTFTVVAAIEGFSDKVTFTVAKYEETLNENVVVSLAEEDGFTFTLPTAISGNIEYIKLGDLTLYNAATGVGSVTGSVCTADSTALGAATEGAGQTLTVYTEMTKYTLTATVATKYIKTADDLRDLGVGTNLYANNSDELKGDITGYYVLADDITIEEDNVGYSDVFMAGYTLISWVDTDGNGEMADSERRWFDFAGTFDGNGHTIDGLRFNEGGIFGTVDSATIKNVNFTNVKYMDIAAVNSMTTHQYYVGGFLAWGTRGTVNVENVNVTIAQGPQDVDTIARRTSVLFGTTDNSTVNYKHIVIDAEHVQLQNVLGQGYANATHTYENVVITAEGYKAIAYNGDATAKDPVTEWPTNVTFIHSFKITNTETVEVDSDFPMTVNNTSLDITYTLKEAVDGVSISGSTVSVAMTTEIGASFTVVATSSEGYVQEMTFTTTKVNKALEGTVTIEAITDTLDLSGISGISGTINSVKIASSDADVEDLTIFSGSTTETSFSLLNENNKNILVKMAHLGENKAIIIETASAIYTVNANVYTMIIDTAEELDQWQAVAADNSVAAGLVIEAQKNAVLSGYFALGGDIEYNKVWTPIAKYAGAKGTLYQLLTAGVDVPADTEGAIWEDWGAGKNAGFKGVFDGNGYAIKGMETSGQYNAFIITMGGGTIKDVAFTGAKIGSKTSLIANRGNGTYENIYVQVTSMASGVSGTETQVFMMNTNTNHPTNASGYSSMKNIIVDVSAISFAELTYAKISQLAYTRTDGFYVLGVELNDTMLLDNNASTDVARVFRNCNANSASGDYDIANAYVNATALMADEAGSSLVKAWGEPWSTVDNAIYFGDYVVYDGVVEIIAEAVDVNFGHTLSGTSVVIADKATVDLSEIYDDYVAGNTVVVTYGDTTIYDGVIDSASWAMPLTAFTAKDGGMKQLLFTIGNTKITLPINIGQNTIELNGSIVVNATALKAILDSNPYGHYVLTSDLDLNGNENTSPDIGGLLGVENFYGTLDGQGYMITNTYIYHNAGYSITGSYDPFFIMNNGGTIKNLGFDLDYITYTTGSTKRGVVYTNNGVIENVYVSVSLKDQAASSWCNVGVVVGINAGTVNNVIADITVADGISLDVTDLKVAAVLTNNASVTNVYVITNGNDKILGVASGTTSGATTYTAWNEVSTDTITAMGEPWSVVDKAIYFGNTMIYDGWEEKDLGAVDMTIALADGTFTLPDALSGKTVESVEMFGTAVFTSQDGDVITFNNSSILSTPAAALGENTDLIIKAENVTYILQATVYTDIITTVKELKALGMGENNKEATGNLYGYYVLGCDINITHADDYSDLIAAGYHKAGWNGTSLTHQYSFNGVFDGMGYTIDNARVSDGGFFGWMTNATIRNVNITNVTFLDNLDSSITNQRGDYIGLLGFTMEGTVSFQDIYVTVKTPASGESWKRDSLFVCDNGSFGKGTGVFENITIDASFLNLKTIFGIYLDPEKHSFTNVVVKAESYKMIAYTKDTVTSGVENVTKFPSGVTFEVVADVTNVSYETLPTYEGDVTSLGFAAGSTVYTATVADSWNDRIIIPADMRYDYMEFELVLTNSVSSFTVWPAKDKGTKGSMTVLPRGMTTSDGLVRTIHVFKANGDTIEAQSSEVWAANTKYTIRIGFNDAETVQLNEFHLSSVQTFYVANVNYGNYNETDLRVYDATTGTLHGYYDGDVTALGFAAGTKVSTVENTNLWTTRVNVGGDQNYDYIDVQLSSSVALTSLTVWTYKTDGLISAGSYGYNIATTVMTPASAAFPDKRIQLFDANGNIATSFAANTVYTLRIQLNGESYVNIGTGTTTTLYFGDITFGNYVNLDETTLVSIKDGTFTLPDVIEGNVECVTIGGVVVYDDNNGSVTDNTVTLTKDLDCGADLEMMIVTDQYTYYLTAIVATDVITTTQELRDLGVGGKVYTDRTPTYNNSTESGGGGNANSGVAGNDVTGYYVLGNDLDFADEVAVAAGYSFQQSWFKATFDGNGYTIYNVTVNEGGIFGSLYGATIKNVNFVGVVYDMSLSTYAGQYSQQTALLAHVASSSTFENINVQVRNRKLSASGYAWATLVYTFWNTNTLTNVNVDASGIELSSVLGTDANSQVTYTNVNIKAAGYATMGKLGSTDLTECPSGVTFTTNTDTSSVVSLTYGNSKYILPYYTGDETLIGFEEGTMVSCLTDTVNYASRVYIPIDATYDYVDVQFATANAFTTLHLWGVGATSQHCSISTSGVTHDSGNPGRKVYILDANGESVTAFAANTVYTLRVYIKDESGTAATTLSVTTLSASTGTIYFGSVTFGNDA